MIYLLHASNSNNELEIVGRFADMHFAKNRMETLVHHLLPKGQSYSIVNDYGITKVSYDINITEVFAIFDIPSGEFDIFHYSDETNKIEMLSETTFCTLEDAAAALEEEIETTDYKAIYEERDDDDNLIYGEYEDKEDYMHSYKVVGGKSI